MALRTVIVSSMCGLAVSAMAQIAPPPTERPTPLERPIRPPPQVPERKIRELQEDRQREIAQERVRQQIAEEQRRMPPLPYESLVERTRDGSLERLVESADFVALQRNPMVSQIKRDRLNALASDRRRRVEARVVERMDLFDALVLDGLVERVRVSDRRSLDSARSMLAEFTIDNGLTAWLAASGQITQPQAVFNNRIVAEYRDAVRERRVADSRANPPTDGSPQPSTTDLYARHYLSADLEEYAVAYDRLVDRLVGMIESGSPAVPNELRSAAMASTNRRLAVRDRLRAMSIEERAEVLALALR